MPIRSNTKEVTGALIIASGLALGGVITIGARHLGLSTPGLLFEEPGPAKVQAALREESSAGMAGGGGTTAAEAPGSSEAIAGRRGRLAPVDINSATPRELEAIDGIGPALAGRIVALRKNRGGCFRSYKELLDVKGIGPATLERIRSSSALVIPEGLSQKSALRKSISTQADSSGLHR